MIQFSVDEKDHALVLAHKILERPNADPDDDVAVLARQLIRARERLTRTNEITRAAKFVCAYDWSDNDEDAVRAIARLRTLVEA